MKNFERQLKDIQVYADQILFNEVGLNEIRNFSNYSNELKEYINPNINDAQIRKINSEIPSIEVNIGKPKNAILSILMPHFLLVWFFEAREIEEGKVKIGIVKSKFASIDFLLKANS